MRSRILLLAYCVSTAFPHSVFAKSNRVIDTEVSILDSGGNPTKTKARFVVTQSETDCVVELTLSVLPRKGTLSYEVEDKNGDPVVGVYMDNPMDVLRNTTTFPMADCSSATHVKVWLEGFTAPSDPT